MQQNTQSNVRQSSQIHLLMSQYLSAHVRQDLFSCLLPRCYRNTPTQAHPARSRLLRFLVFLLRYMFLGLLSLVSEASLNQRAVGSTPPRPTTNQPLTASTPLPPEPTVLKCDTGVIRSRISTPSRKLSG